MLEKMIVWTMILLEMALFRSGCQGIGSNQTDKTLSTRLWIPGAVGPREGVQKQRKRNPSLTFKKAQGIITLWGTRRHLQKHQQTALRIGRRVIRIGNPSRVPSFTKVKRNATAPPKTSAQALRVGRRKSQ